MCLQIYDSVAVNKMVYVLLFIVIVVIKNVPVWSIHHTELLQAFLKINCRSAVGQSRKKS